MAFEKNPDEMGALWTKTDRKGQTFMSGEINGQKVVVFATNSTSAKAPHWRIFKSRPRDAQAGQVE